MLTFRSPSNRVTVQIDGPEPLDSNERDWLFHLVRVVNERLAELRARPTPRHHEVRGGRRSP